MSMAHMMGERRASGRSRSRRAAFSQTAGQEIWRRCSDDRDQDLLPDQTQSQELPIHLTLAPLSLSELSVSVSTGQADRKRMRQGGSFDWSCPPLPGQVPVEPTGTSDGRTAQGAMEASPVNEISTGQADRKRMLQSGSQQSSDDGHAFTSSSLKCYYSGHSRSRRTASTDSSPGIVSSSSLSLSSRGSDNLICRRSGDGSYSRSEQGRSESFDWSCPPLPGQVPVEPTGTSDGRTAQGAMEASPVNEISTGQADRKRMLQSNSRQSLDDGHAFTSSSSKCSCMDSGHSRSRRTASTDSSPGIVSSSSLSLSSRGSYNFICRRSGDGSYSRSEQGRSDSLESPCPPLPGQVPVEQTGTSDGRTAQGAMEASPVNEISTEKPTECSERNEVGSFFKRLWKTMKSPFGCCCLSSAVDVVEPDPEPSSSDHSGVKPNDESFESLYKVGKMIGSGGFGRVYKGTRKSDGKKVAIKQICKIDNDRYLYIPGHPKPLVTEVALLLMMRREPVSPLIIQLYEWFEHPGKFTLVMEFPKPCVSLLDYIVRKPVLYEPTARFIMRQALLAVQICIEHGVFHNDIHAQNFLLKESTLELKLIDFGCGQLFSSDGYESKTYTGVPHYCPPEVLTERRFHAVPANVWALGVLLYTMVHGFPPFHGWTEIRQANVTFPIYNLSKGKYLLSLVEGLRSRLESKPDVQPQPDRELRACPRLSKNTRDCKTGKKSSSHHSHICFVFKRHDKTSHLYLFSALYTTKLLTAAGVIKLVILMADCNPERSKRQSVTTGDSPVVKSKRLVCTETDIYRKR